VLSREELVIPSFDNSGRRFGWLQPVVFSSHLERFSMLKGLVSLCVDLLVAAYTSPPPLKEVPSPSLPSARRRRRRLSDGGRRWWASPRFVLLFPGGFLPSPPAGYFAFRSGLDQGTG
jgi:hypothetical protein